tara:strand:+ start:813 stop:1529 length:717 start_codon:yes stop_codon:yes gene_type:complete
MITRINLVTRRFIDQLVKRFWTYYHPDSKGFHYFTHSNKRVTFGGMQSFLDQVLGEDNNPIVFVEDLQEVMIRPYDRSNSNYAMASQLPNRLTVTPMDLLEAIERRASRNLVDDSAFNSVIHEAIDFQYAQGSEIYWNHNLSFRLLLQPNSREVYQICYALGKEIEAAPLEWKMLDEEYFYPANTSKRSTYHDSEQFPDMWDLANLMTQLMIKDLKEEEEALEEELDEELFEGERHDI